MSKLPHGKRKHQLYLTAQELGVLVDGLSLVILQTEELLRALSSMNLSANLRRRIEVGEKNVKLYRSIQRRVEALASAMRAEGGDPNA